MSAREMSGDEWIDLAKGRMETAVTELAFALSVAAPTKTSLCRVYHELEAAGQHLLDAGFAYGIGDLR